MSAGSLCLLAGWLAGCAIFAGWLTWLCLLAGYAGNVGKALCLFKRAILAGYAGYNAWLSILHFLAAWLCWICLLASCLSMPANLNKWLKLKA
jgi:hypothetical protein